MLLREDGDGVLAIGQPAHAWLSGQLARAWGNDRFGAVWPLEEVCLGAEQHDVGMAAWDLEPEHDPETGLPYSFMEMPLATHLELWRAGPRRLLSQSRYAALLASMHGYRLYERRDLGRLDEAEAGAVRGFLTDQRAWQSELLASLRADPAIAAAATPEVVRRNSDLIWTWDFLSLAICLDWAPCTARDVPTADGGAVDIRVSRGESPLVLDPWPFSSPVLTVGCEGRRLKPGVEFAAAPWETLPFRLVPLEETGGT